MSCLTSFSKGFLFFFFRLLSSGVPAKPLLLLNMEDGLFDLTAGSQPLPQGMQYFVDGLYLTVRVLPLPFEAVQVFPLVGQGVYLRLQRIPQHSELGGGVDPVLLQETKLRHIAVQPCDLPADAEGQRRVPGGWPADTQQVQVVDIQGAKAL